MKQRDGIIKANKKIEEAQRNMESKIEELSGEIEYRADFLQKERDEVQGIQQEVIRNNSFMKD